MNLLLFDLCFASAERRPSAAAAVTLKQLVVFIYIQILFVISTDTKQRDPEQVLIG